jgi:Trk-type K+ transport system membrane component
MGIRNQRHNRILTSTLLLVMALAVLAKAVIPAGFMPNEGMTAMVICSGMGEKTVMVLSDQGEPSDHKTEACAYHLAALQKIVSVVLAAIPVATNPQIPHALVLQQQHVSEALISATSSRGPPALV